MELINLSPVDDRYHNKTKLINNYFSEFAYIKYRLQIEIEYLLKFKNTIPELKNSNLNDS